MRAKTFVKKQKLNEDISSDAHHMEKDHEVQMARSDLFKIAKYAIELHKMLKNVSEEQGLEGWVQAKITKPSSYIGAVMHYMEYLEVNDYPEQPPVVVDDMPEEM